jgi:hypothetical protein
VVALAREILLKAAEHRKPTGTNGSEEQFEQFPSWGFPAPRVEAAAGLLNLTLHEDCLDDAVLRAVETLSADAVPVVRMHVAQRIYLLRVHAPEFMWQIAKRLAEEEESRPVLTSLVTILPRILNRNRDRLREVVEAIYRRIDPARPGSAELRNRCVDVLTIQHVWDGDEAARDFLDSEVIDNLAARSDEARHMLHQLREPLTRGNGDEQAAIRGRAIKLMSDVLRRAIAEFRAASESLSGRSDLTEDSPEVKVARDLASTIDVIGMEIYFSSGTFDEKQNKGPKVTREQRERLYHEIGEVLDQIADAPLPAVTHHLVETLETFIEFDPRGVFVRLGKAIRGGKPGGYQFDPMAADLFVRIVERYLAERRTLIQKDDEVRELLIEMLDVFVEAGSPKARKLTYGLHELFR